MEYPYKERGFHKVEVKEREGGIRTFLVPFELIVEDLERLLERQIKIEEILEEEVDILEEPETAIDKIRLVHNLLLEQLLILFERHNEVTLDWLRKNISLEEAQRILQFFENERFYKGEGGTAQKKTKLSEN